MAENTTVGPTPEHPFKALSEMIHADPEYAWGWQCNLAVPIMDAAGVSHTKANQAAALIMAQMFGYDITTHECFVGGKSSHQLYHETRVECERLEDATLLKASPRAGEGV